MIYRTTGTGRHRNCQGTSSTAIPTATGTRTVDFDRRPQCQNLAAGQRDRLCHPHGAGRAGRPRTRFSVPVAAPAATPAGCWFRCCVTLGFAARFVSGYLIQLKPDHGGASTALPAPTMTSPTCTPGPRSTSPAPAGSALTPPPACSPARATFRWPPRRISAPRRRFRAATPLPGYAAGRIRLRDGWSPALPSIRASPSRSRDDSWTALNELGRAVDERRWWQANDVRLTMGGEPTFRLDRRFRERGMEHRRCRPGQSAFLPIQLIRRLTRPLRAGRLPALRPGQMVSRRDPCRAGPFSLYWRRDQQADLAGCQR